MTTLVTRRKIIFLYFELKTYYLSYSSYKQHSLSRFFIYFTQNRTGDAWEWRRDYHSRLPRVLHMVSVHMVQ